MGSWGGFGKDAAQAAIPTLPDYADESVQKARKRTLLTESLGQGRVSTFTSGPRGIAPPQPKKTILGA